MSIQLFKPNISEEAIQAVVGVLRSGWIGLGPRVDEFETRFAEYVGAGHAVALNSCTSALHLALVAAGIGDGDEVITTPLTFVSTNHAILYLRAVPVFADVDPRTYCISVESIERNITLRTRAVIAMHYGGHPCDLDAIYALARKRGISVIEDAAHACGASYKGKKIGSRGLACFSFHAVKNLPVGDGGMITTGDRQVRDRLRRLRWLGIDKSTHDRTTMDEKKTSSYAWKYDIPEVGYKYHMNDISAAIGLAQLKLLDEQNTFRRRVAAVYDAGLKNRDIIAAAWTSPDVVTAQHLYVIRVNRRDDLIAKMKARGISPGVHYVANNVYPMYRQCKADVKTAMELSGQMLSLPLHTLLSEDDVKKVIDCINSGW